MMFLFRYNLHSIISYKMKYILTNAVSCNQLRIATCCMHVAFRYIIHIIIIIVIIIGGAKAQGTELPKFLAQATRFFIKPVLDVAMHGSYNLLQI